MQLLEGNFFQFPYLIQSETFNTKSKICVKIFVIPLFLFLKKVFDFPVQSALLAVQYGFGRTAN